MTVAAKKEDDPAWVEARNRKSDAVIAALNDLLTHIGTDCALLSDATGDKPRIILAGNIDQMDHLLAIAKLAGLGDSFDEPPVIN